MAALGLIPQARWQCLNFSGSEAFVVRAGSRRPCGTVLRNALWVCDSAEFGGYAGGFGRAGSLEDLVCPPQLGVRVCGAASGQGTSTEAC
jgi:hypothetical protein